MSSDSMTFIGGLLIGITIGILAIMSISQPINSIVKHGCGQYNSTTGAFEWVDGTKDDEKEME